MDPFKNTIEQLEQTTNTIVKIANTTEEEITAVVKNIDNYLLKHLQKQQKLGV